MESLSVFLSSNALPVANIKYTASKRFLGKDKKPVEWEICAVTTTENEDIQRSCIKAIPVPGKKGQYARETDYHLYLGKLAARCTVFPNLSDAELQNSYKVMGADALLKAMLTPGEYDDYLSKVQEINNFSPTLDEMVDNAKN